MIGFTDLARELADACDSLRLDKERMGYDVLAESFEVPAWSTEFYQIIFTLSGRVDELKDLVMALDMDDDLKAHAHNHLDQIKLAFTPNGLNNQWSHALSTFISPAHVGAVRMLSPAIRATHSFPKLSDNQANELLDDVSKLISWLEAHQLREQDFIRQALIEGLGALRFRLMRVKWLGWGYTIQSLRDVIGAYMALERGIDASKSPDAEAVLKKTSAFVKDFFDRVKFAQEAVGATDWLLRAYGTVTLTINGAKPIAGLLTNLAS